MSNLATIQKIKSVKIHPNADALDLVQVLGWQVVVKRGEFKEGDLAIYICIDTIVPETPTFEFLRNKHFRIKPIRLRQAESAGICFPINIVPGFVGLTSDGNGFFVNLKTEDGEVHGIYQVGDDVTDIIGVKKYEKPVPAELAGQMVGHIPGFLKITDEDNLRTYPDAIFELQGRPYYITRKDDGCSGTYFQKDGEFGVCSRRIHLKDTEGNGFWKMARKYDIQNVLAKSFPGMNIAVQGEVCGPGIQGNKLGLKEMEFHIFNLFDIQTRIYLGYTQIIKFCQDNQIPMVHTIIEKTSFQYTLEDLLKIANEQKYYIPPDKTCPAEGIVIRPQEGFYSPVLKKTWSAKVLNENYKEKE